MASALRPPWTLPSASNRAIANIVICSSKIGPPPRPVISWRSRNFSGRCARSSRAKSGSE
jgi:hypothetical protein